MEGLRKTTVRWLVAAILLVVCAVPLGLLGTSSILSSDDHSIFFLNMSGEYWNGVSRQLAACMVLAAATMIVTLVILVLRPRWLRTVLGTIASLLALPIGLVAVFVIFLMGSPSTVIKETAPDGRSVLVRQWTFFGPGDIDVLIEDGPHTYRSYGGLNFGGPLEWVDANECDLESPTPDLVLSCTEGSVRILPE